jgi:hypothetical protein
MVAPRLQVPVTALLRIPEARRALVRSSHSAQGNPHTVEEVRRILRLHAGLKTGTIPPKAP